MIMAEPTMEVIMERFDAHAARWRLACHRQAAVRLLDGQQRAGWPGPAPDAEHAAGARSGG